MKKTVVAIAAMLLALPSIAQENDGIRNEADNLMNDLKESAEKNAPKDTNYWSYGGNININFNNTTLTNWAAGGSSSISGNGLLHLFANRKKGKGLWENSLDLAYGLLKPQDEKSVKTDDRIEFTSKYGREAWNDKWYYTGLLNFRTQFTDGFDAETNNIIISKTFAPAYLIASIGLNYKPNDNFSLYISPLTNKNTFVTDDSLSNVGAFGVDPGETYRFELGGFLEASYKIKLMENIDFLTKINLFSNYLDNPQNIDVSWENLITMKVNNYINVSFSTHLLYDHDIDIARDTNDDGTIDKNGPVAQYKQVLAVGFAYNF